MKLVEILKIASKELAQILDCDPKASNYISWQRLSPEDESTLELIYSITDEDVANFQSDLTEFDKNYWKPNFKINLSEYPYYGCDIYKRKECNSFYLVYTEYGGHVPEKRARLLRLGTT